MKKKFSFFCFLIFFLIHSNVFSKDNCSLFFNELKDNSEKYQPQLAPSYVYEDFGFELETYYNEDKDEWNYKKDSNGFYLVGNLTSPELADKLKYVIKLSL